MYYFNSKINVYILFWSIKKQSCLLCLFYVISLSYRRMKHTLLLRYKSEDTTMKLEYNLGCEFDSNKVILIRGTISFMHKWRLNKITILMQAFLLDIPFLQRSFYKLFCLVFGVERLFVISKHFCDMTV